MPYIVYDDGDEHDATGHSPSLDMTKPNKSARIVARERRLEQGRRVDYYVLLVAVNRLRFTVRRRFNEFLALDQALSHASSKPELPDRGWPTWCGGVHSAQFLCERARGLQQFINQALALPPPYHRTVEAFLSIDSIRHIYIAHGDHGLNEEQEQYVQPCVTVGQTKHTHAPATTTVYLGVPTGAY